MALIIGMPDTSPGMTDQEKSGGKPVKRNKVADRPGSSKTRQRLGRGIGSGSGKTAGRGGKGQTARSGVRIKGFEGGQMPLHRRLPKRGFTNIFAKKLNEVNLGRVQDAIEAGKLDPKDTVDSAALVRAGVLRRAKAGVRLLGSGEIKAKLNFEVHGASKSAVAAVEKAGGSVKGLGPPQPKGGETGAQKGAAPKGGEKGAAPKGADK